MQCIVCTIPKWPMPGLALGAHCIQYYVVFT